MPRSLVVQEQLEETRVLSYAPSVRLPRLGSILEEEETNYEDWQEENSVAAGRISVKERCKQIRFVCPCAFAVE